MAPKPIPEYPPGSIVFAKLRGYPWWPARVEDDSKLPSKVLNQKGKTKGPMWTVFFFGSKDYGFFGPDSIRPFDREMVERDFKANKFKTKDLTAAIEQALDPTEFDKEMKELREAQRKVDEQERKEMAKSKKRAPAKKEPSPAKKAPVPKSKPAPEPKAKATPAAKQTKVTEQPTTNIPAQIIAPTTTSRKRRGTQTHQDQPEAADNPRDTKRSRTTEPTATTAATTGDNAKVAAPVTNGEKTLAVTTPVKTNNNQAAKPSKSPEPVSGKENSETKKSQKKLYHLRHKLQKLVYERKEEDITLEDYTRIDAVLSEIESLQSEVTYEILKETKIGKVMKNACGHTFANDTKYRLRERCLQLMKKWKVVLLAGSAEEKSANGAKKSGKTEKATNDEHPSEQASEPQSPKQAVEAPKIEQAIAPLNTDQATEPSQLLNVEQATTTTDPSITKELEMPLAPKEGTLLQEHAISEEQVMSDAQGKELTTGIQEAVHAENQMTDTVMEDSSNADLPSTVVSQAAMDLVTDPTLDLLGQST